MSGDFQICISIPLSSALFALIYITTFWWFYLMSFFSLLFRLNMWSYSKWALSFTSVKTLRKKCPYSELFWSPCFSHFPSFGLNTEIYEVSVFSPNAGKRGKNVDQNNYEYGHFLRGEMIIYFHLYFAFHTFVLGIRFKFLFKSWKVCFVNDFLIWFITFPIYQICIDLYFQFFAKLLLYFHNFFHVASSKFISHSFNFGLLMEWRPFDGFFIEFFHLLNVFIF